MPVFNSLHHDGHSEAAEKNVTGLASGDSSLGDLNGLDCPSAGCGAAFGGGVALLATVMWVITPLCLACLAYYYVAVRDVLVAGLRFVADKLEAMPHYKPPERTASDGVDALTRIEANKAGDEDNATGIETALHTGQEVNNH